MEANPEAVSVEYPSRALVKLRRAADLFRSLERDVDRWNEEHQLYAPTRSPHDGEPRLEIFRPEELDQLPMASWESAFHDGVHNLRVALDTFCFELCSLETAPRDPGRIHFPITKHPNEWLGRIEHLDTMPPSLLERVRQCQAWNRPDQHNPDPLSLLSRVDNVDKHRATGVTFEVFAMSQWAIRPSRPLPLSLAAALEWPLERWMELRVDPPVERGAAHLMPVMAFPFVMFEGLCANLADGQRWLHHETTRIISFIASGEWRGPEFQSSFPGPVWSPWPLA